MFRYPFVTSLAGSLLQGDFVPEHGEEGDR